MTHLKLAVLLGMTVALGPLALDAYLPAFPAIANDLGVASADIGLTLSVYVAALGLAQLIGGPLSDRYGRQRILFFGLATFAVAALMVSRADTLSELLAWRVLQGLGGAFCAVSVPAIVRDQTNGSEAARLFGLIGLVMFVAPAAAPSIGTLLLAVSQWSSIFVLLGGYALLLMVVLHLQLFRKLPVRPRSQTPMITLLTNYRFVLGHGAAMRFIGLQALAFSAMLVFITHASFIYQEWFGLSSTLFSILFAANIVLMAVLNLINRRLLLRFPAVNILRVMVLVQVAAMVGLVITGYLGLPVWVLAVFIVIGIGSQGGIVPNNMACALEFFPTLGGTAAATLGAIQFTVAGAISALSTVISDHQLLPILVTMLACSAGASALALGAPRAMARALERAESA